MEDTDEDRVDSVGTILQHLEVKVVDQNGNIVPRNTPGELMTKGYELMKVTSPPETVTSVKGT
jgi:fatty-acyl-CoA synthase